MARKKRFADKHWNVYVDDFNAKEIGTYDIMQNSRFVEDARKAIKECETRDEFAERIRRDLMYYFWSKCEWEIILSDWPPSGQVEKKIDVFDQVMLNFDVFVDYLWEEK